LLFALLQLGGWYKPDGDSFWRCALALDAPIDLAEPALYQVGTLGSSGESAGHARIGPTAAASFPAHELPRQQHVE